MYLHPFLLQNPALLNGKVTLHQVTAGTVLSRQGDQVSVAQSVPLQEVFIQIHGNKTFPCVPPKLPLLEVKPPSSAHRTGLQHSQGGTLGVVSSDGARGKVWGHPSSLLRSSGTGKLLSTLHFGFL